MADTDTAMQREREMKGGRREGREPVNKRVAGERQRGEERGEECNGKGKERNREDKKGRKKAAGEVRRQKASLGNRMQDTREGPNMRRDDEGGLNVL